jgi:hypothetical protein
LGGYKKEIAVSDIKRYSPAPPGHLRVVEFALKSEEDRLMDTYPVFQQGRAEEMADNYNRTRKNKHLVCLVIDEHGTPIYGLGQLLKPESETVREPVGASFQPAIA